ncbi:MAG: PadR family transcriptional regulator [Terracidiphilus sp.]|jgi:DNA-binding PadR family transcriptional regulator
MAKRSSSSMEVLLGLLTIQSMSGYDLGQTIRGSVGHFWNESYGQIYPSLKSLASDGYVSSKTERQKGKPDRKIYSITKKGQERLARWLAVPPQPEIPRNELLLKIFFGVQTSPEILIGYMDRMLKNEREVLQELTRIEQEVLALNPQFPDVPYWKMAARFGQFELDAHVRWAEETLVELNSMARNQRSHAEPTRENQHAAE